MADGVLRLTEEFVQTGDVVMAVRQLRIRIKCSLIRGERGGRLAQIFEQYALVEKQQRVRTPLFQRAPVHVGRLARRALLVQQAPPVDPGCGIGGVLADGGPPGGGGGGGGGALPWPPPP